MVRIVTIVAWTVAIAALVGFVFMRAVTSSNKVASSGAGAAGLPIVYEFTTST